MARVDRDIDKIIGALTSPVRREILALIWDRELPAGEIAAAFHVTKPTISQHLGVLRDAGLVTVAAAGTSRRYQARPEMLDGLHGALEGDFKWTPADDIPEASLARARTAPVVIASVEVETDQETTFRAFTDPETYSRWLGAPVTIIDGRFAATMEWGTEVRGRYELVYPPHLIVMRWDFEDGTVPIPGGELTGYLRVRGSPRGGAIVEVHQLVDTAQQAPFMQAAWTLVLGRLRTGVGTATNPNTAMPRRPRRPKRRQSG
jgi:DNA-binding transcriptional ArsR family regulator